VPDYCEHSNHMFYLLVRSAEERQSLISHLESFGVAAIFHYQPLHLSRMGLLFGGKPGDCPIAEAAADRLLRLPFYNDMTESDLAQVVSSIQEFETQGSVRNSLAAEQSL